MLPDETIQKWASALRGGEYEQGPNVLYNPETDTYCCLGVLCKIVGAPVQNPDSATLCDTLSMPSDIIAELGLYEWEDFLLDLEDYDINHLADLNDGEGRTFEEIATVIEDMHHILKIERGD